MKKRVIELLKQRDEISKKIFELENKSNTALIYYKREKERIDSLIIKGSK